MVYIWLLMKNIVTTLIKVIKNISTFSMIYDDKITLKGLYNNYINRWVYLINDSLSSTPSSTPLFLLSTLLRSGWPALFILKKSQGTVCFLHKKQLISSKCPSSNCHLIKSTQILLQNNYLEAVDHQKCACSSGWTKLSKKWETETWITMVSTKRHYATLIWVLLKSISSTKICLFTATA